MSVELPFSAHAARISDKLAAFCGIGGERVDKLCMVELHNFERRQLCKKPFFARGSKKILTFGKKLRYNVK